MVGGCPDLANADHYYELGVKSDVSGLNYC
jgi:hypothetical protein